VEDGNEVTVLSHGRSLELIKMELGDTVKYIDSNDYPLPYTERSKVFLIKFSLISPRLITSIINEHKSVVKMLEKEKYDMIISDNRYGVFHRKIPSYFITHQLRVIAPARIRFVENNFERFNSYFQRYFEKIMVPDYEEDGISGDLAHNLNYLDTTNVEYFGIVSDFNRRDLSEDVDYLFSISGPEPQRQVLEDLILDQINDVDGKIILSLGRKLVGAEKRKHMLSNNIRLYDFLPAEKREQLMNRSKFIVSRSGYSTLMDIYALGKKGLFIPTPYQTEQEYLAKYQKEMNNFLFVNQEEIDLKRDLEEAKNFKGTDKRYNTENSINKFMDAIYS
jgi:UDP-N-acetylglucosamine transferase subunit ALG13